MAELVNLLPAITRADERQLRDENLGLVNRRVVVETAGVRAAQSSGVREGIPGTYDTG